MLKIVLRRYTQCQLVVAVQNRHVLVSYRTLARTAGNFAASAEQAVDLHDSFIAALPGATLRHKKGPPAA